MDKILLLDAARRVDKSRQNEGNVDIEDLEQAVGIVPTYRQSVQEFYTRFKAYYIIKWQCTDSWVGLQAIFFDDELIATSWQEGRKCGTDVDLISIEAAEKVYNFLAPKFEAAQVSMVNAGEVIDPFYTVSYGSQLLVKEGFYNGKKVTVTETYHSYEAIDLWRSVVVRHEDGQCETINIDNLHIPLHIIEAKDDVQNT